MENNSEQLKFEATLNEIIEKVRVTSRFMTVATNQMGKTNAMMHLWRALIKRPDHAENKIKSVGFDPALNFRFKFDSIPYVDRTKVKHVPLAQDLIVDIPFINSSLKKDAIMEVLLSDFVHKRQLKEVHEGKIPFYNFYIIDEMQNVWGSYALRSKEGESALTVFSESSNYGMVIMGISQRFADVATGIVERCAYYLVGALSGSNEITRLEKMVDNPKIINRIRTLKRSEFIFIDKDNPEYSKEITFHEFKGNGKPYPFVDVDTVPCDGFVRELF
jgi:hypothetical protein